MSDQIPIDPALEPYHQDFNTYIPSSPFSPSISNSQTMPRSLPSTDYTPQGNPFTQIQFSGYQTQTEQDIYTHESYQLYTPGPKQQQQQEWAPQSTSESYTPPQLPHHSSPIAPPFQSQINTPGDIKRLGLERVFRYIKELEAQNQSFRDRDQAFRDQMETVREGLDDLAGIAGAADIENAYFWADMNYMYETGMMGGKPELEGEPGWEGETDKAGVN